MPEFTLDLASLRRAVEPDPRIPVKGNEHRMEKVAFDVFRLDSEPETLWKVQSDDDGNEFLVRCYDEPEQDMRAESGWSVDIDRQAANLTVSYRSLPVHRLRASDYGARTPSDARVLQRVVRQKLAADAGFAARLLASLPSAKTAALASTFPELRALAREEESAKDDATEGLMRFLAATYALYTKTQGFHWNVRGSDFGALHKLFNDQYDELAEAVDLLAERIRAKKTLSPGSLSDMAKLSQLPESPRDLDEKGMIAALLKDNEALSQMAAGLLKQMEAVGDEATANMLAERIHAHDKAAWMLRSHLEEGGGGAPARDGAAWAVSAADGSLQVRCEGKQVAVLAGSDYGISTPDELEILRQVVSEKVASDPAFVRQMLLAQAEDDRDVELGGLRRDEDQQDLVERLLHRIDGGDTLSGEDLSDLDEKSLEQLAIGLKGRIHEISEAIEDDYTRSGADAVMGNAVAHLSDSLQAVEQAAGQARDRAEERFEQDADETSEKKTWSERPQLWDLEPGQKFRFSDGETVWTVGEQGMLVSPSGKEVKPDKIDLYMRVVPLDDEGNSLVAQKPREPMSDEDRAKMDEWFHRDISGEEADDGKGSSWKVEFKNVHRDDDQNKIKDLNEKVMERFPGMEVELWDIVDLDWTKEEADKLVSGLKGLGVDAEVRSADGEEQDAGDGSYKAYFEKMMDAEGIDSPAELSDEQARAFFRKVDRGWKSKSEKKAFLAKPAMLVQRHNDETDRKEWALVSKSAKGGRRKVLKWFGPDKPSDEKVRKEEKRVQYFKHHAEDAPGVL